HTRISEALEEALKREAHRRRLPVSLLVRNVLEGALDLVEDIVESGFGVAEAAQRAQGRARGARRSDDDLGDVYGWQELILHRGDDCARCGTQLRPGGEAYRGLRERPGPPVFLCTACVRRLRRPASNEEGSR